MNDTLTHLARRFKLLYYIIVSKNYTEAYARFMDKRVKTDPEMAVGEINGMGRQQFEYLKKSGLEQDDTLLEIGCGIFRAGEHFIEYLDSENYIGLEISEETIEEGFERLDDSTIQRDPVVYNNEDLRFEEIDTTVDFIIAHSVFSHAPEEVVRECFENVSKVMEPHTEFYFTFFDENTDFGMFEPGGFKYSKDKLASIGESNGIRVTFPEDSYCTDHRQTLACATLE